MPRFKKKQVEVEAVQWTGGNDAEVDALVGRSFDATQVAAPGDWLVMVPDRGLRVFTPQEFEATFEPADRDQRESQATVGLPPELAQALSDPTIIVDRDREITLKDGRTLAEHLEEWSDAPSTTVSALPVAEQKAFLAGYRAALPSVHSRDQQGDTEEGKRVVSALQAWVDHHKAESELAQNSDDSAAAKEHKIVADAFEDAIRIALGALVAAPTQQQGATSEQGLREQREKELVDLRLEVLRFLNGLHQNKSIAERRLREAADKPLTAPTSDPSVDEEGR